MGQSVSFLVFATRPPLDPPLEQHHVWVACAAAALVMAAAIPPVWRDAELTIISHQAERARERARPAWEHLCLDILLLIPVAYGYWQLRQTNAIGVFQRTLAAGATPYEDPLLYIVPVLFIAAGAMLLMRLLPLAFRLLLFAVRRFAGTPFYLSLMHLARHPRYYTGSLLVLVLMTSLGVYTAAVARTLDANLRDRTFYAVGTDLVLAERSPNATGHGAAQVEAGTTLTRTAISVRGESMWVLPFDLHRSFTGVAAAARVGRYSTNYRPDKNKGPADLLAIETGDFRRVAFWRHDFGAQDLSTLLNRLAGAPHNILAPRRYLAQTGLRVGEEIRLSVDVVGTGEWMELPFVIAGVFDYFPTVYPAEKVTFIANLPYLAGEIGGVGFYDVWLRTAPGAHSAAIVTQVQQQLGLAVPTVNDALRTIGDAEKRPERIGFFGTLSAGVLGVGGLAVASYTLFVLLNIRRRSTELGVLRSLGLRRGEVVRSVLYEQFMTLVIASVAAIALGVLAAYLFIPFVEVGRTALEQVPPYLIHIAFTDLGLMIMIASFALLVAIVAVIAVVIRQRLGEALRLAGS
jgi:putative ABC transport system permease protein